MAYYDEPVSKVLTDLAAKEDGLRTPQARERLERYGPNEIVQKPPRHWAWILIEQFNNPVIWVLMAALIIAFFLGELIDAYVILAVVILNAVLGYVQERKAEKAIAALKRTLSLKASVLRDGRQVTLDAAEVVPGDILILESGMKVPADARLFWESSLNTQESAVTGESMPVKKTTAPLSSERTIGDQTNMVFAGTIVTSGRGRAVVIATGMRTQVGTIAHLIQETPASETPLQKRLATLSKNITVIVVVIALVVFIAGWLEGQAVFQIFLASVALAVAAIPEGLPAIVTLALAFGVQRMARRNALVRRLPSVETLGACTVICSDKTGTLTHDQMTVRELYVPHRTLAVSGAGYSLAGTIEGSARQYGMLLRIGARCNNATLEHDGVVGDPTEGALLVSAHKGKVLLDASSEPRVAELQFTSERKRMTTIHAIGKKRVAYTKGAADTILSRCDRKLVSGKVSALTADDRRRIRKAHEDMARRALRVLAFAYRELAPHEKADENIERRLIFVGLQAMIDPPRAEAKTAIATAQQAGIRVIMITGDHPLTAAAIAKELGIPGRTMTGEDIMHGNLAQVIDDVGVFARVDPLHKLRIIEALKKKGHIVAMTGDGVNDAPALKKADIGIAMGKSGTDVAREASDMVLADDNFATIVEAVAGGRTIMDNIVKFVCYMLGTNLGEVLTVFVGIALRFPLPLTALMLLWINLLTDGPPAIALSLEKPEPGVMQRKPRRVTEGIITPARLVRMLVIGVGMMAGTLALFSWRLPAGLAGAQTLAFTTLVLFQLVLVFSYRSERFIITKLGVFRNVWLLCAVALSLLLQVLVVQWQPLQALFGTVSLSGIEWLASAAMAFALFLVAQLIIIFTPTPE